MSKKDFLEILIPVQDIDRDALSGLLFFWGCQGIYEPDERTWLAYFPGNWSPEHTRVLFEKLSSMNRQLKSGAIKVSRIPLKDWTREWQRHFKSLQVARGVWVRPPWETLPQTGQQATEIVIKPAMAFGTGHHETTRLMIRALTKYSLRGKEVLDVGTGSGILAILCEKLGASSVLAIDTDIQAIENARENLELNQSGSIQLIHGDIQKVPEKQFDFILANINLETLLQLAFNFFTLLKPGGLLIMSGVLKDDLPRLSYIYKQTGLVWIEQLTEGEWAALVWENRSE